MFGTQLVVGNANYIYPPKWFLGQRVGLKCHEDVIDALGLVLQRRSDVVGVLIGGAFGAGRLYERRLQARAQSVGNGRIRMHGLQPPAEVLDSWPHFDCAVHVPLSENCGGVIEPLFSGVPTIASRVGGLTEVVMDGLTGKTVTPRNPSELASAILEVLNNLSHYRMLAKTGQQLVRTTFDVERTAQEILQIYRHILDSSVPRPSEFDTAEYAAHLTRSAMAHC
jgi:glycosyltransferase involved in cell wall biosynthesis